MKYKYQNQAQEITLSAAPSPADTQTDVLQMLHSETIIDAVLLSLCVFSSLHNSAVRQTPFK